MFKTLVGRNEMAMRECPFHFLLSIPPKSGRNTHSFDELEVKYRFCPCLEKREIKGKEYNNKLAYFFPFHSIFYKLSNTLKKYNIFL